MLDQHFMIDKELLQRIVTAARIKKTDILLEIGPGTGNLTELLLGKGKELYVIEKDPLLLKKLKEKYKEKIHFRQGDATQIKLPAFHKSISNLPYTICEPLLWKLTRYDFDCAIFVVPHKFTELLLGTKSSRLHLLVDSFYEVEYLETIHPSAFDPQPKVQSALIKIIPKKKESFLKEFLSQYDKKTKNALEKILCAQGKTKSQAREIIALKIRPKVQEQNIITLSLEEIEGIQNKFSETYRKKKE